MKRLLIVLAATLTGVAVLATYDRDKPAHELLEAYQTVPDVAAAHAEIADALSNLPTTTTSAPVRVLEPINGNVWDRLAWCETRGDWTTNTGNGFGGGLQFAHGPTWSTWLSYGGGQYAPHPWEASREQQIAVAETVLASSGWGAWPGCARLLGLL